MRRDRPRHIASAVSAWHDRLLASAAAFGASSYIGPTSITAFSRKNLPGANWGRSVALFTFIFAVGRTLGPVSAGFMADATDSLTTGLVAAAIILLVAGTIAGLQRPLADGTRMPAQ